MKKLLSLILPLFFFSCVFGQGGSYNQIPGNQEFKGNVKLFLNKNNVNLNYVLATDTSGKIISVLNAGGSGSDSSSSVISPIGAVIWDSLLVFHTTRFYYKINGVLYTAPPYPSITVTPPTFAYDRWIRFYGDTLGNIGFIQSSYSNPADIPNVDPSSQIALADYFVPAFSTVPFNISNTAVYKENVEWTVTTGTGLQRARINPAYTVAPFQGLYSLYDSSVVNGTYIDFTDGTTHTASDFAYLSYQLKLLSTFANNTRFVITFMNGNSTVSSSVTVVSGNFGYDRTIINTYQAVAIPISQFNFQSSTFNRIRISLVGANATGFQLDNLILQQGGINITTNTGVISWAGMNTPPRTGNVIAQRTDYTTYYDSSHLNFDSTRMLYYNNGVLVHSDPTLFRKVQNTATITWDTAANGALLATAIGGGGGGVDTTFNSIASLRAYDATGTTGGKYIQLSGYYGQNDGGGGLFVWNSTSIDADNGGTIIKSIPVLEGRWIRVYNGNINTNWFGAIPNGSRIVTTNLQAALDITGGIETPYHSLKLIIDDRLIIKSNTNWSIDPLDTIYEASGNNTVMLRNENLDTTGTTDHDIILTGGLWDGNWSGNPGTTLFSSYAQLQSDKITPVRGAAGNIGFFGVNRLQVSGVKVKNPISFGIQVAGCKYFNVDDVYFQRTQATVSDGIHINGPAENFLVNNVRGKTGDDFIALNAWDWLVSSPIAGGTGGDIKKGVVQNIMPDSCTWGIIRANVGTNAGLYDVDIKSVKGVSKYVGINFASGSLEPDQHTPSHTTGMGTIGDITLDDISIGTYGTVSGAGGIVYGPAVVLACNADNLIINNAVIDSTYYPFTGFPWMEQNSACIANNVTVSNFVQNDATGTGNIFDLLGTMTNFRLVNSNLIGTGLTTGTNARHAIRLHKTTAASNVFISNSNFKDVYGILDIRSDVQNVFMSNNVISDVLGPVFTLASTSQNFTVTGNQFKNLPISAYIFNHGGGAAYFSTSSNTWDGSGIRVLDGSIGTRRWIGTDLDVDIALLTPVAYDIAKNSNAGSGTLGLNQWDGAVWVPFGGGSGGAPAGSNTEVQYNNSGAFGASPNLTFNGTTLNVTGSTTANSGQFGSFGLQSYSVNNAWLSDNMYFDGANFKYRANGYGVLSYFSGGKWGIYTAPNSTAGATATITARFNVTDNGQVGINASSPDASAKLQIDATDKGLLIPRMNTTEMNAIPSPANGLMICNTDSANRIFVYRSTGGWTGMAFTTDITGGGSTQIGAVDTGWHRKGVVMRGYPAAEGMNNYEPSVIKEGNPQILTSPYDTTVFKMWYTYGWLSRNIGYAESPDGVHWTKYTSNPVISGNSRSFVLKNGSTYWMFSANAAQTAVDVDTSSNGVAWVRRASSVITGTLANMSVIIDGGTWKMLLDQGGGGSPYSLSYYTSSDGVTWTAYGGNPVISGFSLGSPFLKKIGSTYYCWLLQSPTTLPLPTDLYRYSSPDMITWTQNTPLGVPIFPRRDADESPNTAGGQVADPFLLAIDSSVYMYYAASTGGNDSGSLAIKLAIANMPFDQLVQYQEGDGAEVLPDLSNILITGVQGNQTIIGSTISAGTLTILPNNAADNGFIYFGGGNTSSFDAGSDQFGAGTGSPTDKFEAVSNVGAYKGFKSTNNSASGGAAFTGINNAGSSVNYNITGSSVGTYGVSSGNRAGVYTTVDYYIGADGGKILLGTGSGIPERWRISTTGKLSNTGADGTDFLEMNGNVALMTAGNKLKIATGSNASVGQATLSSGTVTVSTTAALTGSLIYLTVSSPSGTQGFLSVGTITNATSFVINSTSVLENSVVNWWIIN